MAEPVLSPKTHVSAPTVPRMARISGAKSPKLSRPFHLDWVLRHQIEIASTLILGVVSLHTLHRPSRAFTRKFLQLSYASQTDHIYQQGPSDLYFVSAWVVNFTALRAILIEWILRPVAGYMGVAKKSHLRFAEQGWLVLYYGIFWTLGMYLWVNSPYWLNNQELWTNWPAREMSGTFKWYYLVQLAFWIQQILVIHIEARRKDHTQMLTHHIITCILISVTYVYRYTRAANVVLCLMDVVDFLLPLLKVLRYLHHETACNVGFALFVVTWFGARHVMYLKLCYDIYMDVPGPNTMLYGCYSGATYERLPDMPAQPDYFSHLLWPFQNLEGVICLNGEVKWIFLGMLGLLQLLSMIWFVMVLRVIAGILTGKSAEDTRSDDEGDAEPTANGDHDAGIKRSMNVTDLNICVGSSAGEMSQAPLTMSSKPRATSARRKLVNMENKKEMLARIGCEKPQ